MHLLYIYTELSKSLAPFPLKGFPLSDFPQCTLLPLPLGSLDRFHYHRNR